MKVKAGHSVPIKMWVDKVGEPEQTAFDQLYNLSSLPFIYKHLAVMPDVHAGTGSTVGSVIATKGAIIPAAVGVDIGCGMMAQRTSLTAEQIPDKLSNLRADIEQAVPSGVGHSGSFHDSNPAASKAWKFLQDRFWDIEKKHPKAMTGKAVAQLGTLGSGNHFIELCLDEEGFVWVMLHSGSRGIGNSIGRYFTDLAMEDMKTYHITLADKALAYFPEKTNHFNDYVEALNWAQEYAMLNRELMMAAVLKVMQNYFPSFTLDVTAVNCHHNYAVIEHHFGQNVWVTRKGAVRARQDDLGIIPGSMGAKSYIVRGKGNADSFHSCSHGAGRKMSRAKAKAKYTVDDLIRTTEGVECNKSTSVLDEIPLAYKKIDAVMESQADLVDIVHILKQFLNVKGT